MDFGTDKKFELENGVIYMTTGWLDQMFSGERGIPVPTLGFTIPHSEIFARD